MTKVRRVLIKVITKVLNNIVLFIGLLERMRAGDFDQEMVDYNAPDPPDID